MKIEEINFYSHAEFIFNSEPFMLRNEKETFLIGYDHQYSQLTALGLTLDDNGDMFCYMVKQEDYGFYMAIIKQDFDTNVELKSDASTGFWESVVFRKEKISENLHSILDDMDLLVLIEKVNSKFMLRTDDSYSIIDVFNIDETITKESLLKRIDIAVDKEEYERAAKLKKQLDRL
jgi:hypothetical protein